ncbi:MAG: SprT-like domain-containing protein [Cellvibrionaceae bacterium]
MVTIKSIIEPIDEQQQQRVIAETHRYIGLASKLYQANFSPISIVFNLRGRAAGIYRCYYDNHSTKGRFLKKLLSQKQSPQKQQIRFNPWLFAKYPEDSWDNTIPHEVAHYITDCRYGLSKIRPHGVEWKQTMRDLGAEPIVRADYDLSGIPIKRVQRYSYSCQCREVELTAYRHKKIQRGLQEYRCKDCLQSLVLS